MLIEKGDGIFVAGEADVLCILKLSSETFHVAFFEEHPMLGPIKPIKDSEFIRLKSKMHHTSGASTIAEAQEHLKKLREKIEISDNNVVSDEAIAVKDPVCVWVVGNWIKNGISFKDQFFKKN